MLKTLPFPSEVAISVAVIFGYQAINEALNHNLGSPPNFNFIQGTGEKFAKNPKVVEIIGSGVGYAKGRF